MPIRKAVTILKTKSQCCAIMFTLMIVSSVNVARSQQDQLRDTTLVWTLYEQGRRVFAISKDSTYRLFMEARDLADSLNFLDGRVALRRGLSGLEALRLNTTESLAWAEEGIDLVQSNHLDEVLLIDFYINQGVALNYAAQPGKALEGYLAAEELARKLDMKAKQGIILNNIGSLYRQLKRYDQAEEIYQQAIQIRESLADTLGVANNWLNLAAVYAEQQAYEQALQAASEARIRYLAKEQVTDVLLTNLAVAEASLKLGKDVDAAHDTLVALSQRPQLPFELQHYAILYIRLGESYLDRGEPRKAEEAFANIGPYLEDSELTSWKLEYYQKRADALHALQQSDQAFMLLKKHQQLMAAEAEKESQAYRREMETKYLTRQKEWEIERQQLVIDRAQRQRWFFWGGLLFLGILALLLFRINQIRKQSNQLLREKNQIIERALREKDILLREIHHRVKNNLQFISSLLGLQSEHIADAQALSALQEGQDRVQSMALIHQNLYQEENLTGVDVRDYFMKLIRNLFDSYNIRRDRIKLDLDIEDINLDVDTVIPIGLIVNELVSNALKYAFPGTQNGQIQVTLKEEEQQLLLKVGDDGIGMSKQEIEQLGRSFGYRLIEVFKEQLQAELDIQVDQGTAVSMLITNYRKLMTAGKVAKN